MDRVFLSFCKADVTCCSSGCHFNDRRVELGSKTAPCLSEHNGICRLFILGELEALPVPEAPLVCTPGVVSGALKLPQIPQQWDRPETPQIVPWEAHTPWRSQC